MPSSSIQVLPVFFDLEMSNLNANYGRILCGCVKPWGQPVMTFRADHTAPYKKEPWNDREVAVQLRDALEGSFTIYGYNSVMFDIKYLSARLMKHHERALQKPLHKDLLFTVKYALALSDSRLITVQEFLGLDEEKTRLDPDMWVRGTAGDPAAMDYIVDHCVQDVKVLEQVFDRLVPFIKEIHA